jgi:hypothetical protein
MGQNIEDGISARDHLLRRLLHLQHQVDRGRHARAAGAPRCRRWQAPRPGTHLLLAGRRRRRAHANT